MHVPEQSLKELDKLSDLPLDTTLFVGLGNRHRQDDAIGLFVAERIHALEPSLLVCTEEHKPIETILLEMTDKSYVVNTANETEDPHPLSCPDLNEMRNKISDVVLIDAAILPTFISACFLTDEQVNSLDGTHSLSTHQLPLQLLLTVLRGANYNVHLVAIAPHGLEFGKEMTEEVLQTAEYVLDCIFN